MYILLIECSVLQGCVLVSAGVGFRMGLQTMTILGWHRPCSIKKIEPQLFQKKKTKWKISRLLLIPNSVAKGSKFSDDQNRNEDLSCVNYALNIACRVSVGSQISCFVQNVRSHDKNCWINLRLFTDQLNILYPCVSPNSAPPDL